MQAMGMTYRAQRAPRRSDSFRGVVAVSGAAAEGFGRLVVRITPDISRATPRIR